MVDEEAYICRQRCYRAEGYWQRVIDVLDGKTVPGCHVFSNGDEGDDQIYT